MRGEGRGRIEVGGQEGIEVGGRKAEVRERLLKEELGILVQKNLFSYNLVTGEYQPQGPSVAIVDPKNETVCFQEKGGTEWAEKNKELLPLMQSL